MLQANLGASMAYYEGSLWRETPVDRADECYRDLWMLADHLISSFNVIGRGGMAQYIGFSVKALESGFSTYLVGSNCIPLFMESPAAYTPMAMWDEGWKFYAMKAADIVDKLFMILLNADGFTFYKYITQIAMDVEDIIRFAL